MTGLTLLPTDSERPTLKTIAAETGLAIATVSRALKDAPDIGEETKKRVREAAKRLGYRPNRAGVRLRTGKTNVIALTLSTEADVMNTPPNCCIRLPRRCAAAPTILSSSRSFPIRIRWTRSATSWRPDRPTAW